MALQSLDIVRRSATTHALAAASADAAPAQVAKLIDTTKCIGCKACQVACMEWNDLRDEIGTNIGRYQNPHDLSRAVLDGDALRRGTRIPRAIWSG